MISSTIQALFKIKIQPNMSEQEKKTTKNVWFAWRKKTKPKFLYLPCTKQRTFFFTEKELFKGKGGGGLNKKWKEGFLTALNQAIKKGR